MSRDRQGAGVCGPTALFNAQIFKTSRLVEQILPPLIVALAQQAHQMTAGMQTERTRRACQTHSSFFRSAAALAIITRMAAGHQVLPSGFPRARSRNHV